MSRRLPPPAPRRLGAAVQARLDALEPASARPFAAAVVEQSAHPLGAGAAEGREAREAEQLDKVLLLLRQAGAPAGASRDSAIERIAADAPLLAAAFVNGDLLFDHGFPHADGVAAAVMEALARMEEGG